MLRGFVFYFWSTECCNGSRWAAQIENGKREVPMMTDVWLNRINTTKVIQAVRISRFY